MMKIRKLKKSEDAVVGIVVAFLITGLIVIVVSTIQMVYIPKWMEQAEADHMEIVADQFSQLKFSIDTQSVIKQPNMPISTSITLGNKEMPFLMSSRSYGNLDILSDECIVTITNDSNSFTYQLGTIKYSSANSYFLNQAYIYEAGAVILSQSEGDMMTIKPAFSVKNEDHVSISFSIINVSTLGEKSSIGGYGSYPIQTEYTGSDSPLVVKINHVSTISIGTKYQNSWQNFFNKALINSGLNSTHFFIEVNDTRVSVQFLDHPSVNLEVIKIGAQIAPGWIENIKGT
jgi:hypothetical protein